MGTEDSRKQIWYSGSDEPKYKFNILYLKEKNIMRKLMNKKGFSLVELMIVVVIMGILIAVAIPLYGAITANANNKTCANNIKTIKSNAAAYKTNYNSNVATYADIESMFEDKRMPECPLSDDGDHTNDYTVGDIDAASGAVSVQCANYNVEGQTGYDEADDTHDPSGHATVTTGFTGTPTNP